MNPNHPLTADTIQAPFVLRADRKSQAMIAWVGALAVAAAAVGLRFWNINAIFESSDQAAMAYLVRHCFGLRWIMEHDYGPVLPLLEAGFARAWTGAGLASGETAARLPVALVSLALVAMTYPLMRQLHVARSEALMAAAVAAVLPPLVTDAHYLWSYGTCWLCLGVIALWALLRYFDGGERVFLVISGAALFLHCLANVYSLALPLTLLVAWTGHLRRERNGRAVRHATAGYVLPCAAAMAVILGLWWWTGQGQIGHLLDKHHRGVSGIKYHQLLSLPEAWASQLGWIFGIIAAGGLLVATWQAVTRVRCPGAATASDRRFFLLMVWAWAGLLPIVLLTDWNSIGYPYYYIGEAVYATALLGVHCLCVLWRRGGIVRWATAGLGIFGIAQMSLGSLQVLAPDFTLGRSMGISTGWGNVRADTGVKAAACYVRRHVPVDATILSLHTRDGMELPVAEYYCGRSILAHYDTLESSLDALWRTMATRVDVVLVDARHGHILADSGFECVCTLRRNGQIVRMVFARSELHLPMHDSETSVMNEAYDRAYRPTHIPLPLSAPPGFDDHLREYQAAIVSLRATAFATRLTH